MAKHSKNRTEFYVGEPATEKKPKSNKKLLIAAIAVAVVLALGIAAYFIVPDMLYNHDKDFTTDKSDLGISDESDESTNQPNGKDYEGKIVNVALFGIDTRDAKSFSGRSDSIMVLSLNFKTNKVKIISIMRDSLVEMHPKDKKGEVYTHYAKVNNAYAKGGPELAVKTLNENFGLNITDYASVNFFGMAEIIDAVGGIDAELTDNEATYGSTKKEVHSINDYIMEISRALGKDGTSLKIKKGGKYHLNGIQAVAYSRIRYYKNIWGTSNDFGRTERQRYVMEQLFNKALAMKTSEYPKLIKAMLPYTKTSLDFDEILNMASLLIKKPTFEQYRLPDNKMLMTAPKGGFGSVVYYDIDYAKKAIKAITKEDITLKDFMAANPVEKNDWYTKRTK